VLQLRGDFVPQTLGLPSPSPLLYRPNSGKDARDGNFLGGSNYPGIDVKTFFCVFFILVTFFTFFINVFLFSKRFFIFKNVGKVQSGKQINKALSK